MKDIQALEEKIASLSAQNGNSGPTLFYTGINSHTASLELSDAGFNMIDNSEAADFISNDKNRDEIRHLLTGWGWEEEDITQFMGAGLWDISSEMFARAASGCVEAIIGSPNPNNPTGYQGGTFFRVELPALLDNAKVTHINSIPKHELLAIKSQHADWQECIYQAIRSASPQHIISEHLH